MILKIFFSIPENGPSYSSELQLVNFTSSTSSRGFLHNLESALLSIIYLTEI